MISASGSRAVSMTAVSSASVSCMALQVFARDEQRGDGTAFVEILAQDQFMQGIEFPWHHVELLGFVARQAFWIQVAREHQMGLVAHVGRREGQRAQHLHRIGAVAGFFHQLAVGGVLGRLAGIRSEEHTSELQSLMRISYAVFCLKKKNNSTTTATSNTNQQ